jgi:hypothetical protein
MEVKKPLIIFLIISTFLSMLYLWISIPNGQQWMEKPNHTLLQPGRSSWPEVQQERKENVEKVCRTYNHLKSKSVRLESLFYASDYHLMFCGNAKAGSTTYMMTTFAQILYNQQLLEEQFPEGL